MTFPETRPHPEWNITLCMDELSGWYIAHGVCVGRVRALCLFSVIVVLKIVTTYDQILVSGYRLCCRALPNTDLLGYCRIIGLLFNKKCSCVQLRGTFVNFSDGKFKRGKEHPCKHQWVFSPCWESASITSSFVSHVLASLHSHIDSAVCHVYLMSCRASVH